MTSRIFDSFYFWYVTLNHKLYQSTIVLLTTIYFMIKTKLLSTGKKTEILLDFIYYKEKVSTPTAETCILKSKLRKKILKGVND